jgi:hypothetical protein
MADLLVGRGGRSQYSIDRFLSNGVTCHALLQAQQPGVVAVSPVSRSF